MISTIIECIGIAAVVFAMGFIVGMKTAEGRYDDQR